MITRSEMFEPLLAADPSFQPQWREFLAEWAGAQELPHYRVLADYARYLIACVADGNTQNFAAIFEVVERWFLEGDDDVQNAAFVGLLEDLQNLLGRRDQDKSASRVFASDFSQWMGPETKHQWDHLHRCCGITPSRRGNRTRWPAMRSKQRAADPD